MEVKIIDELGRVDIIKELRRIKREIRKLDRYLDNLIEKYKMEIALKERKLLHEARDKIPSNLEDTEAKLNE